MILHVTHNDLDGVGCGILVKSCLNSVHTVYTSYDELEEVLKDVSSYSSVIISDLGPKRSTLERIAGESELILIDHHESTVSFKDYPFVYHSIDYSATMLTYKYFTAKGYDLSKYLNFVECVNDFDLWHLKRDDSLRMNMLFYLLGLERFEKRFYSEPYTDFNNDEKLIISLEEERRNSYLSRASLYKEIYTDKENRVFAFLFAELYASELGNHIINESGVDYVVIVNPQRKKVSLRSRQGVDISLIAMANGGGGHKCAAGFSIDYDFGSSDFLERSGIL